MVWRTNFDRHLDDFVLTHIERGETQLKHETEIFPQSAVVSSQKELRAQPTGLDTTVSSVTAPNSSVSIVGGHQDGQHLRPNTAVRCQLLQSIHAKTSTLHVPVESLCVECRVR